MVCTKGKYNWPPISVGFAFLGGNQMRRANAVHHSIPLNVRLEHLQRSLSVGALEPISQIPRAECKQRQGKAGVPACNVK